MFSEYVSDFLKQIFSKDNIKFLAIIVWMMSSACILYFFDGNIPVSISIKIFAVSLFFSLVWFLLIILLGWEKKWLFIVLSILVIVPSLLVVSAYAITGSIMHRSNFRVIYTTNSSESIEFIIQFMRFKVVALVLSYILPLFLLFRTKPTKVVMGRTKKIIILLLIVLSVVMLCKNNWRLISKRYHVIDFYRSYYDFKQEQKFDQWRSIRKRLKFTDPVISELKIKQPKTFVVIIGESLSRHHMQLYGYPRETNPELTAMKEQLYIFNDVITPSTTTIGTMKLVLTLANHEHPEYFLEKRSIVNLFADAGYDTVWIGNQNFRGNRYNIGHGIIASECKTAFELRGDNDGIVIDTLNKILRSEVNKDKIVFVHLVGSHTEYSKRYPKEYSYFNNKVIPITYGKGLSDSQKKIIDEYDNSVRYNDHIIASIIKLVKARCKYSWVLYFSDHGEELFEYRDMFGHQGMKFSRYMCEIPFILWVSDSYKAANRELFAKLPEYLNRPYSTEDIIHTISSLSKLKYADFDSSRSILSDNFIVKERFVNNKPYTSVPPQKIE
jgi:heptose-I-phosphate ethanolaminephosphotransferase